MFGIMRSPYLSVAESMVGQKHQLYDGEDYRNSRGHDRLVIQTLEGVLTVSWNDYIIQGVQGELYPCKPDIFEATYEPAA